MKFFTFALIGSLVLSIMGLAGLASAGGAGVCVAGVGADINDNNAGTPFVGANLGQHSENGAFTQRAAFQAECCAETGQAPDCFAPVG